MNYRDIQEEGRIEVEGELELLATARTAVQGPLTLEAARRSSRLFGEVEAFIAGRREFDDIPAGDPHLRNAVLYCRQRDLPVSAILTVRKQMIEQWT